MIEYDAGYFGVSPRLLLRLSGSVVPKALFWSLPAAGMAVGLWIYWDKQKAASEEDKSKSSTTVSEVWTQYTFALGFMIVFRMQNAYRRFWEAATLTNELRAEWVDAAQSLVAFSTDKPEKQEEVEKFQHYLVRLLSMIHRAALERLTLDKYETFPVIDLGGLVGLEAIMDQTPDRCEVIYQWLVRLTVKAARAGVIDIAPPILGRCYKELSQGMVKLHNIMKICTIPVPFPLVQMSSFLLLLHWVITPIIASLIMYKWRWSGCLAFVSIFCLWAIYYIAQEIEQPFGTHQNNLPCQEMQADMNRLLTMVLSPECQIPPEYKFSDSQRVLTNIMGKTSNVREIDIRRALHAQRAEEPIEQVELQIPAAQDSDRLS